MDTKEITVNNEHYLVLKLPDAVFYKEQYGKFMELFQKSGVEVQEKMKKGALGDPTKDLTQDVLDDTKNNAVLFPDDLMKTLNNSPDADVSDYTVYLVKPSGVYVLTYLEAAKINFPRTLSESQKVDSLNAQDFINAYE